jgi:hypothetical protein
MFSFDFPFLRPWERTGDPLDIVVLWMRSHPPTASRTFGSSAAFRLSKPKKGGPKRIMDF